MTRALMPGCWSRDRARAIPDPQASELDNVIPMRPDLPRVPVTLTGGRVPRLRRMRLALREFWRFLTAARFKA